MNINEISPEMSVQEFLKQYSRNPKDPESNQFALRELLESVLESVMESEREVFLNKSNTNNNKGNGHYLRNLVAGSWKLNLDVPRDRNGDFRPYALPDKYKRTDESYVDLLKSIVSNGFSDGQLTLTLKQLGLPYSEKEMNKIKEQVQARLTDFKHKELPEGVFAIFIDGYHTQIKENNKIRKACVYSVVSVDLKGKKDLLGFYTFFNPENKSDWLKVFGDLIERGLKKIVMIISDNFPGMNDAIKTAFPITQHQLCYVHLERNVRRHLSKSDASIFNKELQNIKLSANFEDGSSKFEALCKKFIQTYKSFIEPVLQKKDNYLNFLNHHDEIRKHIYTTNVVESLNSRIEVIRLKLGGYFQSVNILESNLLLQAERLQSAKWLKPIPAFASRIYEINQAFNMLFNCAQTQNS